MEGLGVARLTMECTPCFTVPIPLVFVRFFFMANASGGMRTAASRIAWATGILCIACCALPLIGVAAGSAAISGLAVYSERAAAGVAVIGIALLAFRRVFRRAAPSCDLDCSSRTTAAEAGQPKSD